MTEVIVSISGFLTAVVVAVRYAMRYWFIQQTKLEKLRESVHQTAINDLEKALDEKGAEIRSLSATLKSYELRATDILKRQGFTQDRIEEVLKNFNVLSESTGKRFDVLEKGLDQTKADVITLGKDLIMFKKGGKP